MVPVVIVPVLNRYDLLERALGSIDYPVETLLVIDNGGKSSLHEWPWMIDRRKIAKYHVWSMPSNLGVAPSWNLGIKATPRAAGWLLLNSDAYFTPGQLESFYHECGEDVVVKTERAWSCVWVGRKVVEKIGLFSECYVPAYFEDNDFELRAKAYGVEVVTSSLVVGHDNSSTIRADGFYQSKNLVSFDANRRLHDQRWAEGVPEPGAWDLLRRCELGWD